MSWGAVAGAAIGVVGSSMSSGGGGGGGQSQTATKEPWAPLQPWILNNATRGQNLQDQYAAQPFNAQQQGAFQNQANQGAYMRGLVPDLLGQMQGQQLGFDRSNPNARAKAFNWDGSKGGLLNLLTQAPAVNSSLTPMAEPKKEDKQFVQQHDGYTDIQRQLMDPANGGRNPFLLGGGYDQLQHAPATGSYGAFKYGDDPKPGTAAYRDMNEFFLMGGADPWNKYGHGRSGGPLGLMGNSGDSVGGSAAADGSGGGGPGAF
ncbi:hypothetical protein J7E70_07770 [Variovorax paradoxus]|nr:hypothetical protein [Variovorax paradoxus]MBT2300360.1 hypothetical protein [Variovorax paradoxus]